MWVARCSLGGQTNRFQQTRHLSQTLSDAAHAMDDQWFFNQPAYRHAWVKRTLGVLEDHLQVFPHFTHALRGHQRQILSLKTHRATTRFHEPQYQSTQG